LCEGKLKIFKLPWEIFYANFSSIFLAKEYVYIVLPSRVGIGGYKMQMHRFSVKIVKICDSGFLKT
jgi:hypothetical protein